MPVSANDFAARRTVLFPLTYAFKQTCEVIRVGFSTWRSPESLYSAGLCPYLFGRISGGFLEVASLVGSDNFTFILANLFLSLPAGSSWNGRTILIQFVQVGGEYLQSFFEFLLAKRLALRFDPIKVACLMVE